jgi:hypothetical protein
MQSNRLSPRQVPRYTSRRSNIAGQRLILAAEAAAAAAADPAVEATYTQLAAHLARLAARTRTAWHPRERAQ